MKFKLMTPERTLFEGEVVSVAGRAPKGLFEILEGHGPWVSPVEIGAVRVERGDGATTSFAVHGGVIEVTLGSVLVLADVAETADEIDSGRAETARDRARGRIREHGSGADLDVDRARRALARAVARLRASAKS